MGMLYSSSIRSLQGIIEPPVRIHVYEYLYHFMREAQQTARPWVTALENMLKIAGVSSYVDFYRGIQTDFPVKYTGLDGVSRRLRGFAP
jgi:hypothetical protein